MADKVYVYVIALAGGDHQACKVGISKHPRRRLSQLQKPDVGKLCLSDVVELDADAAILVERYAHWLLRDHHIRGEWFAVDDPVAWRAVEEARAAVAEGKVAGFRVAGAGRPHLKPTVETKCTTIRIRRSVIRRIQEVAGAGNMATFIREAVERKLTAMEAAVPRKPKDPDA